MSQANITLTVRSISSTTSIIDIQGDVLATAANALMDAYVQASSATTLVIILNFTALAYMNSSGIGLLITLLMCAKRQHQCLLCYGLNEHYQHIFTLTRLSDVIKIYAIEDEALAAIGQSPKF
jgi:anti-sigma B factor antagonist